MKKLISFLCMIVLFCSAHTVFGEQNPNMTVKLSNTTFGEKTGITLSIKHLPPMNLQNTFLTVIFSDGYQFDASMKEETVLIDEERNPISISVKENSNLRLEIQWIERQDTLTVEFLAESNIINPVDQKSVSFSIIIEQKNLILFSEPIELKRPGNTVQVMYPKGLKEVNNWFSKEISVQLISEKAEEIFFSLDQKDFTKYKYPILLKNGVHSLEYYGVRKSTASESIQNIRINIDSLPPQVRFIQPKDQSLWNQRSILCQLSVIDYSPVQIFIQDQEKKTNGNMEGENVEFTLKFQPGENKIHYLAIDSVGLKMDGNITIFIDVTPPALLVYSPKKSEVLCGSRVEISGKVEVGCSLYMGDKLIQTDSYGNFSIQVIPENKGLNQLNLRCLDLAGNETRISYSYYYFPGRLMEFFIGQSKVKIDGQEKEINPSPLLDRQTNEVYVPLRFICDTLQFELSWDAKEMRALMKKNKTEIELRPNDNMIRVRTGLKTEKIELLYTPTLYKGSVMVPVEFLKKILGGEAIYQLDPPDNRVFVNFCDKVGNP